MKFKLLPKNYPIEQGGSCMLAAEIITAKLLKRGIKDFKVIEGYIEMPNFNDDELAHTWIELKDGTKIDPTIKQFTDRGEIEYGKIKNEYIPEDYLELCDWAGTEYEYEKWGYDREGKKYK